MTVKTITGFQLSTQQARIWSQLAGDSAALRTECEVRIEGLVDLVRLRDVFHRLVQRHEILRTAFQRQAGVKLPFQVILENPGIVWETLDLTGLDAASQG